jgi:DNA-binding NarL/FixJ family response regulator
VFVADDHDIVRRGLTRLFRQSGGVIVVGEARSAAAALARIPATRPQVALLGVRLPDGNGVDVCRRLRRLVPGLGIALLATDDDAEARTASAAAGASAFLLESAAGPDLVDAVGVVAAGGTLLDPPEPVALLTHRELRVFALLGQGLTNREIGRRLRLTEKTVKNTVTPVLRKLGMSRRTQAAVLAAELRIPPP